MIRLRSISLSWHLIYLVALGVLFVISRNREPSAFEDRIRKENQLQSATWASLHRDAVRDKLWEIRRENQTVKNASIQEQLTQLDKQFEQLTKANEKMLLAKWSRTNQKNLPLEVNRFQDEVKAISEKVQKLEISKLNKQALRETQHNLDTLAMLYRSVEDKNANLHREIDLQLTLLQLQYTIALSSEMDRPMESCEPFRPIFILNENAPRVGERVTGNVFLINVPICQDNISYFVNGNPISVVNCLGQYEQVFDSPGEKQLGISSQVLNPSDGTITYFTDTVSIRILPR
jgi:hypothetical protein